MKVYRKVVIDVDTLETIEEDSFEYDGPIAECGGGKGGGGGDSYDKDYNARMAAIAEAQMKMGMEMYDWMWGRSDPGSGGYEPDYWDIVEGGGYTPDPGGGDPGGGNPLWPGPPGGGVGGQSWNTQEGYGPYAGGNTQEGNNNIVGANSGDNAAGPYDGLISTDGAQQGPGGEGIQEIVVGSEQDKMFQDQMLQGMGPGSQQAGAIGGYNQPLEYQGPQYQSPQFQEQPVSAMGGMMPGGAGNVVSGSSGGNQVDPGGKANGRPKMPQEVVGGNSGGNQIGGGNEIVKANEQVGLPVIDGPGDIPTGGYVPPPGAGGQPAKKYWTVNGKRFDDYDAAVAYQKANPKGKSYKPGEFQGKSYMDWQKKMIEDNMDLMPWEKAAKIAELKQKIDLSQGNTDVGLADIASKLRLIPGMTDLKMGQINAALSLLPGQTKLTQGQIDAALKLLPGQTDLAMDIIKEKQSNIQNRMPVTAKFYKEALDGIDVNEAANKAAADASQSFMASEASMKRNMARMGVSPQSGAYLGKQNAQSMEKAKAMGFAKTKARQNTEKENFNRLGAAMAFNSSY